MKTRQCHREQLAAGDFASVELCDCGSLHLTIGAVTLRLSPACLSELAAVIDAASRELALHELVARRRVSGAEAMS